MSRTHRPGRVLIKQIAARADLRDTDTRGAGVLHVADVIAIRSGNAGLRYLDYRGHTIRW